MDFEEDRQQIRQQYSEEFIRNLNSSPEPIKKDSSKLLDIFRNKIVLFGILAVSLIVLMVIITNIVNNAKVNRLQKFANLSSAVDSSYDVSKKYQDLIDNVQIRVQNSNFQVTLSALESDLKQYRDNFSKEQLKQIDKLSKKSNDSINKVLIRLEQAYLNETLDRIYFNEMLLLIEQLQLDIDKLSESNIKDNLKQRLDVHKKSLTSVEQAVKQTILED